MTTTPLAADDWEGIEPITKPCGLVRDHFRCEKSVAAAVKAALTTSSALKNWTEVPIDIISTGPDRTENDDPRAVRRIIFVTAGLRGNP